MSTKNIEKNIPVPWLLYQLPVVYCPVKYLIQEQDHQAFEMLAELSLQMAELYSLP